MSVHHGYVCGCVCERCLDRAARYEVFDLEGRVTAAVDAERESRAYYNTPWKFDKQVPPRPLRSG